MMIRRLAEALSFVVAAGLIAVADTPPTQEKTTTLTVYILRGAADPVAEQSGSPGHESAMPEDYIVASAPSGTSLADLVNHRLEMTAVVTEPDSPPSAPANANAAERSLRRLSVRSLKDVAPNCGK